MQKRILMTTFLYVLPALGQFGGGASTRRAEIRGGGGDGKCTIEVEVDDVAEVEISGDTARLRTMAGRPANWRRFVCNRPMPPNPIDFRFQGVDGRGRQTLVRDPRNGGAAVVRIEDREGGSEGYTFDIMWRGEGGFNSGHGPGRVPDRGPDRELDRRPGRDGGWDSGGWNGAWGEEIVFKGRGRGEFFTRGQRPTRIAGVDLFIRRRSGEATITFDTERGRNTLSFHGRSQRMRGNTILIDVRAAEGVSGYEVGARGTMEITVGPDRRVTSIDMNGDTDRGRFRLRWDD